MSLTLEMPADPVETHSQLVDTTAADAAAEMLDQPDDSGEVDDTELRSKLDELDDEAVPFEPSDQEAAAADEPKPKKKRGRKKKGEQVEQEVAAEEQSAAEVAAEQPSEPAAESPVTDAPIAPAKSDRTILDDIAFAEVQCEQAESVVLSCKEELKEAKKIYDAAVLRLRRLAQAVKNDSDRPLFKQPAATIPTDAALPPASTPNPDAWRAAPISELGLSEKLIEKLEEAGATTIGQLEDLRAQISTGREKWPKGIGKAKITEIEDAIVAWLTANRDKDVFGQAEGNPRNAADIAWEDLTEEQQLDFIARRAVELDPDQAVELAGEEAPLSPKHPESRTFYEAGFEVGKRGDEVTACPWVPGPEMDDWIRGWLAAAKVADIPDAPYFLGAEQKAEEPTAEVDSLDDL